MKNVHLVAVGASLALSLPVQAQNAGITLAQGETLLQVSAEGEVRIPPDAAFLSVGVVTTGTTAREATGSNARTMAAVIAAVRKAGVDARYIRTQQLDVRPAFARNANGFQEDQSRITGYTARNRVSVTVVRLPIASDVIAAAFEAGANDVQGPNLGTEIANAGLAEARADALKNGRAEAEDYAAGLGMRIARVLRVSETRGNIQPVYEVVVTGRRAGAPPPPPPPPPPPIAGGELKRTVTVYIDYALTPK